MIKYKVNRIFKDNSKSLNLIITEFLKIELQKKLNMTCNYKKYELLCDHINYSQINRSNN